MSDDEQPKPYVMANTDPAEIEAMKKINQQTVGTDLEIKDGIWVGHPETGERRDISKSEGAHVVGVVVKK